MNQTSQIHLRKQTLKAGLKAGAKKDIFQDVNLEDSTSPSVRRAAKEPETWRHFGEEDVKSVLKNKFTRNPLNPSDLKNNSNIEARGGGGKGGPGMKEAGVKTAKNPFGNIDSLKRGLTRGDHLRRIGKKHNKIFREAVGETGE